MAGMLLIMLWHMNCYSSNMTETADTYGLVSFDTNVFKVLIVDDQVTNQMLIYRWLKKLGFQAIDIAGDGIEALEHIEYLDYDLILMDCKMPELSGYQTSRVIRELEKEAVKQVSIIAMTADMTAYNRAECILSGMDDVVYKPLQFNLLRAAIYAQLYKDQEDEFLPLPEIVKDKNNGESAPSLVDTTRIHEFTDGNKVVEGTLIRAFIEESEKSIRIMEQNCTQPHTSDWAEAVHSLKGASGNLGANGLYTLCAKAEGPFDESEITKSSLLREIKDEFSAVNDFLTSL